MQLRRTTGFFVLFLMSAVILSACGGGSDSSSPAPLPPTVTTSSVNTPTIDNALINGSVNPNGLATTAWFEYGTDASLATFTKTADQAIAAGTVPQSINATLLNLSAGTKYYYRVAASSTAGTSKGAIDNLTTLAPPPTTVTTQASSVTINSATLNGTVNPNGLATTAWFEYGLDNSLSTVTKTTDQVIGSGKTPVSITQSISGLLAGTTYYFRVAASNAGGPSTGVIQSFVTNSNPPPVANAGTDQSVIMGQSVTLNGSGSSDGGNGGTITYQWTQVAGTPTVTLSGSTTATPTFTAPTPVAYPGVGLTFQLTVTSSRGPSASDNVLVTDKWGFLDNFSTNTIGEYTVLLDGAAASFTYDSAGQRARILSGDDNGVTFTHNLPASNQGEFSLDFNPTVKYPSGGGIWIRLMQNDVNTCYEIRNFDWDDPSDPIHQKASVSKIVGGSVVQEVLFTSFYTQNATYPIKITFSPSLLTVVAFGQTITLSADATSISVNKFQVETRQQAAYYDNIKLEPKP